jgi:predicted neuraminidase
VASAAVLVLAVAGCLVDPDVAPPEFNIDSEPMRIVAAAPPVFSSEPIFGAIAGRIGSHAPSITVLPNGALLAAWYSYAGPDELDGSAIYLARRAADEVEWETPTLHIDRPIGDGNPVLYSEGDRVWLFQAVVPFGWSTARIEYQVSDDCAATWSMPQAVGGPLGVNCRFPPIRASNGELILPAYDDLLQRALFFASTDGSSWRLRSTLATPREHHCIQPSLVVRDDGSLLALLRNRGRGWLWVAAADAAGRHWSPAVDAGFANPDSPALLLRLQSGNLLLVFNDSPGDRRPLSAALSADDGRTWLAPRVLVDGAGAWSYPAAVQAPDGLVHIVYSHDRQRIQHLRLNEAWIVQQP